MNGLGLNILLKLREENARMSNRIGIDYDYSKIGNTDARGHGSDKGKLPNHITFSTESDYSTKDNPGGRWSEDFQGTTFQPTNNMIKQHGIDNYINYFNQYEPEVRLILKDTK